MIGSLVVRVIQTSLICFSDQIGKAQSQCLFCFKMYTRGGGGEVFVAIVLFFYTPWDNQKVLIQEGMLKELSIGWGGADSKEGKDPRNRGRFGKVRKNLV